MANAPTVNDTPAPPAEGRTIHLTVRDGQGETTVVPILIRPGPRSTAQDAALSLFWRRLLPRLQD